MNKLNYLDFAKTTPTVSYSYVGEPTIKYKYFATGYWGHGYYQLTANGRRHPQKKFKVTKQVWNEYQKNICIILP
jgi:hypothetical protein